MSQIDTKHFLVCLRYEKVVCVNAHKIKIHSFLTKSFITGCTRSCHNPMFLSVQTVLAEIWDFPGLKFQGA